jgi:hypothetical protein
MQKYSPEEKKVYFQGLRDQWKQAKELSLNKAQEIQAIIENHGLNISITGYTLVQMQMEKLGLDGLPYLDCKTFNGWRENGFIVKKGEHSKISGITWKNASDKVEGNPEKETSFMLACEYKLFHRSQVEPIQ